MQVVATIADTITVLQRGQVIASGTYAEVSQQPAGDRGLHGLRGCRAAGRALMAAELLRVTALHAYYGESHILHGVDCHVNRGEVVTLLGRNGAGRTTTLQALLGLVGSALRFGADRRPRDDRAARRTGSRIWRRLLPGGARHLFEPVGRGESAAAAAGRRPGACQLDEIYAMFPNLQERRASRGTRLSGGEQQMLAVARILRTGARLLLLDEISEGLAPVIVQALSRTIRSLREQGYTIVMVEQNFRFAAPLADRFYVMEHGRIVRGLRARPNFLTRWRMLHEYLGV